MGTESESKPELASKLELERQVKVELESASKTGIGIGKQNWNPVGNKTGNRLIAKSETGW